MKKFLVIFLAVLACLAATSCENDENIIIVELVQPTDTVKENHVDTLMDVSLATMYWFDISRLVEYYLDIGGNFQETSDYEGYIQRHGCLPVHEYLVWIGYTATHQGYSTYQLLTSYALHEDKESVMLTNYQRLLNFEAQVVNPARSYVQQLKDKGYGNFEYSSWIEPEDFMQNAILEYQGSDPYGYILCAEEIARYRFIFGI